MKKSIICAAVVGLLVSGIVFASDDIPDFIKQTKNYSSYTIDQMDEDYFWAYNSNGEKFAVSSKLSNPVSWRYVHQYVPTYVDSKFNVLQNQINTLQQKVISLEQEVAKLKGQSTTSVSQSNAITKKYYRYSDGQDVFEAGTNRHIGYDEAVSNNIWSDIQVVNK
ncbi:MAG: hypothetical protein PHT44_04070 [Candidatus Portnoybacteria bacterium]|nr:hypothetical protein [Candidatus Portnoybacteria bacterium]MDD4982997.1 hypothetical protein [Candidatus Portnoybacteria bacterium]